MSVNFVNEQNWTMGGNQKRFSKKKKKKTIYNTYKICLHLLLLLGKVQTIYV